MTKNTAVIDTDAIRVRMGQGLWGVTITALCDEVDSLRATLNEVINDAENVEGTEDA